MESTAQTSLKRINVIFIAFSEIFQLKIKKKY